MLSPDVRETLLDANLNLDEKTMDQIHTFIRNETSVLSSSRQSESQEKYRVFAAVAIVCETKLLPQVQRLGYARSGITTEQVMLNLSPHLSKEQFLETMREMCSKSSHSTPSLASKIDSLYISYRIFKKFRRAFEELWDFTGIGKLVQNDMLSIFWIVYLLIKNKQDEEHYNDTKFQVEIICVLLRSVFEFLISHVEHRTLRARINQNFGDISAQYESEDFFLKTHLKIENQIIQIYRKRCPEKQFNFQRFSKNAILIARLLDDANTLFQQQKKFFEHCNYIDEISYLGLRKILEPQGFKKIPFSVPKITKTLDFEEKSDSNSNSGSYEQKENGHILRPQEKNIVQRNPTTQTPILVTQNLSNLTPIRQSSKKPTYTPLSSRVANLEWVNKSIEKVKTSEVKQKLIKCFNKTKDKCSAQEYEIWAKQKIGALISECIPKCIKKEKRTEQTYLFFTYLILQIYEFYSLQESKSMFSERGVFSAILCVSTDIFNFAQHTSQGIPYTKLCQEFEVPLTEALKPINWIGKNISKPIEVSDYLYSLQKKIIIKEIWEGQNSIGYNLIKNQQKFNSESEGYIGYTDVVIWSRLNRHILDRVVEIAQENSIEGKLIKRIQNFVSILLKHKPYLLKDNKIDQIIICCITSFLSINQIQSKKSLEQVFSNYSKIEFGFHRNRDGLKGSNGESMNLLDFYNQVFLGEVQDIICQNQEGNFLLTPNRVNREQLLSKNQILTPLAQKFRESTTGFSILNRNVGRLSSFNFRNNAVHENNPSNCGSPHRNDSVSKPPLISPQSSYRKNLLFNMSQQKSQESCSSYMQSDQSSGRVGSSFIRPENSKEPDHDQKKNRPGIFEKVFQATDEKQDRNFSFGKKAATNG